MLVMCLLPLALHSSVLVAFIAVLPERTQSDDAPICSKCSFWWGVLTTDMEVVNPSYLGDHETVYLICWLLLACLFSWYPTTWHIALFRATVRPVARPFWAIMGRYSRNQYYDMAFGIWSNMPTGTGRHNCTVHVGSLCFGPIRRSWGTLVTAARHWPARHKIVTRENRLGMIGDPRSLVLQ